MPFSPDQRTEAGPSGCGEGGILCLVWGHWVLTVKSLSASPVGLGPWEGGPPPMPVLRQRGWFGVNWAERGWPPQGALDPWTHLCMVVRALPGGDSRRQRVPDAPAAGLPTATPPTPQPRSGKPSEPGPVLQVLYLPSQSGLCCPSPCLDSPPLPALKGHKLTCSRSPPLGRSRGLWVHSLLYHKCLELLLPCDRHSIKVCGLSGLTP